jgi:hypothetical protein
LGLHGQVLLLLLLLLLSTGAVLWCCGAVRVAGCCLMLLDASRPFASGLNPG